MPWYAPWYATRATTSAHPARASATVITASRIGHLLICTVYARWSNVATPKYAETYVLRLTCIGTEPIIRPGYGSEADLPTGGHDGRGVAAPGAELERAG